MFSSKQIRKSSVYDVIGRRRKDTMGTVRFTSVLAKFPPLALVNHGLLIIPIHLIGSISLSPLHL